MTRAGPARREAETLTTAAGAVLLVVMIVARLLGPPFATVPPLDKPPPAAPRLRTDAANAQPIVLPPPPLPAAAPHRVEQATIPRAFESPPTVVTPLAPPRAERAAAPVRQPSEPAMSIPQVEPVVIAPLAPPLRKSSITQSREPPAMAAVAPPLPSAEAETAEVAARDTADLAADRRPAIPAAEPASNDGRVALVLLEHGKGPLVRIAWPETQRDRDRLYRILSRCHGMVTVLMDRRGMIYGSDDRSSGVPVDLDRFSGFVRQVDATVSRSEAQSILRLRQRYQGVQGLMPVHLFPRASDARLLAELAGLIGRGLEANGVVHARYRLDGGTVTIGDVVADGTPRLGSVRLNSQFACE